MATSPQSMQYLRDLVHRRSAIVVDADKDYLIETRLGPLARKHALGSIEDLTLTVRRDENGAITRAVIEAMTTNETSFFRDAHPFEALRTDIIPRLLSARAGARSLRIWCAAASTGQEPFSIAMLLREAFPALASWNVQIVATDLNQAVLDRARAGLYKQIEVDRGLPAPLLVKYFERCGGEWQIKEEIRKMVSFAPLNLLDSWPLITGQDVIFMRNVLIYFDLPTKRRILCRVREALRPDGLVILGGGETTLNLDDGYVPVRIGPGVYYQPKPACEGDAPHAA